MKVALGRQKVYLTFMNPRGVALPLASGDDYVYTTEALFPRGKSAGGEGGRERGMEELADSLGNLIRALR